jgi:hypothetical protein
MKKFILLIACLSVLTTCKKKKQETMINAENNISPRDILSDAKYKSLDIDIVYDKDYPPSAEMTNNLKSFLNSRINKPGGITVMMREINGSARSAISIEEIREVEKKNRSYYSSGSKAALFIYMSGSDYNQNQGDAKVLGVQYGSTSLTLFVKTMKAFSGGLAQPSYATLETTVTRHELGHVLGLVDHGTQMLNPHKDAAHGAHCDNTNCLMYYQAETSDVVANLLGGKIPEPDGNCINDLRNNGGK